MMKRRNLLFGLSAVATGSLISFEDVLAAGEKPTPAKIDLENEPSWASLLTHQSQQGSAVYMTREISPSSLLKVFDALKFAPSGKTALKISFESPGGPGLDPVLLAPLCQRLKATLVDCNGFTSPRDTTNSHLELVRRKGYSDIASVDILDSEGDMELPVDNGYRLAYAKTGSHFVSYETMISVVRFKAHHLPRYGGTLKNLSICLGSLAGKALIHSGGKVESHYSSTPPLITAQAMSDAVKGALAAKPNKWAFIQVMSSHVPDDNCEGAKDLGDIGIFASLDPVALDQLAVDIAYGSAPDESTKQKWMDYHSAYLPEVASANGVGSNYYRLVPVL